MESSDPPRSPGSTPPEGVVPGRDEVLGAAPASAPRFEPRTFTYGSVEVAHDEEGAFTILGAEGVPAKDFGTFLEMLVAFARPVIIPPGASPTADHEEPEAPKTVRGEGECQKCQSAKQQAHDDLRRCLNCGFEWRVE